MSSGVTLTLAARDESEQEMHCCRQNRPQMPCAWREAIVNRRAVIKAGKLLQAFHSLILHHTSELKLHQHMCVIPTACGRAQNHAGSVNLTQLFDSRDMTNAKHPAFNAALP